MNPVVESRLPVSEPFDPSEELSMQYLDQMPVLYAAAQYSLLYLLCGGGVVGAVVIYFGARALGK